MPEVTAPGADQSSTPPGQEAPLEPLAAVSEGTTPGCLLLPCRGCPCPSQNRPSAATSGASSIAAKRAVVGVVIESDVDEQPFFLASSEVVVLLGGRHFILTAAPQRLERRAWAAGERSPWEAARWPHHADSPRERLRRCRLSSRPCVPAQVPRARRRSRRTDRESDPAATTPFVRRGGDRLLRQHQPDRRGAGNGPGGRGPRACRNRFPSALGAPPTKGLDIDVKLGTRGDLGAKLLSIGVCTIPASAHKQHPFSEEPPAGRWHSRFTSPERWRMRTAIATTLAAPDGFGGGPLVAPEGNGLLVGLVRGAIDHGDSWDEWCEPAARGGAPSRRSS